MVLCFREIELAKKMKSCLSVASFFFFLRLVKPWNVSLRYFFSSHVQLLRAFGCDEKYPKLFLFHFKKWTAQKIYKSKYIPAQTTFRQQKDKLNYIYITYIDTNTLLYYRFIFEKKKKKKKKTKKKTKTTPDNTRE